jgi:hypothetical protein
MADDRHARLLLRRLVLVGDEPEAAATAADRQTAKTALLLRCVELFRAYDLEATEPREEAHHFTFAYGRLTVRVRATPTIKVRGEVVERGEDGAGARVVRPLDLRLATLAWDPSDRQWYAEDGGSAIDALIEGLLRALNALQAPRAAITRSSET